MSRKAPGNNRKIIVAAIAAAVILVVGASIWFVWQKQQKSDSLPSSNTGSADSINYNPPTEQEQQAGDNRKDELVDEQNNPPTPSSTAEIVIVDASQYQQTVEIRAFVSNRVENGGLCKVTLTKDSGVVTKTKNATADASTTQCGAIDIPRGDFSSGGTWNVLIEYSSESASGSATTTVNLK